MRSMKGSINKYARRQVRREINLYLRQSNRSDEVNHPNPEEIDTRIVKVFGCLVSGLIALIILVCNF